MRVIAWSQNLTTERAAEVGATLVSKDELFQEADIVSIHLVLSGRTRGLFGTAELALMKPTARLIKTSPGGSTAKQWAEARCSPGSAFWSTPSAEFSRAPIAVPTSRFELNSSIP